MSKSLNSNGTARKYLLRQDCMDQAFRGREGIHLHISLFGGVCMGHAPKIFGK